MGQGQERVNREDERQPGAALGRGPRPRSPTSSTTSSTSTSRTTSSAPLAWTHAKVEGRRSTRQLLYIPARAPFDLWDREHRRAQALRAARVHHGRRRAPAAGVPALRARRGRLQRPAAQRLARDPAAGAKDVEAIRAGSHQAVLGLLERAGRERAGEVRDVLEEFGRVLKEGVGRGLRTASASRSCCGSPPRTPTARSRRFARRLRRAHEGGAGHDLLRHRRHLPRGEEQPAPRDLPQEGHRGAAALRPRRRVAGREPAPSSTASRSSRSRAASSTWASSRAKTRRKPTRSGRTRTSGRPQAALGERVKDVRITQR